MKTKRTSKTLSLTSYDQYQGFVKLLRDRVLIKGRSHTWAVEKIHWDMTSNFGNVRLRMITVVKL